MDQKDLQKIRDDLPQPADTIGRLRNRSWLLRVQGYLGMLVNMVLVFSLIWFFTASHKGVLQDPSGGVKSREPYDYRLMENRHAALADRLKEFGAILADAKQELISDKYGKGGANQALVSKMLQSRAEEMGALKADIEDRLAKDRQNMYLEVTKLREERDLATREGGERRIMLRIAGDAVLRIGILILAIYLISIITSVAKYWLRVADHLNSVADSLDLLRGSGLSVEPAIAALTPHPIDFHVDDVLTLRSIKDMVPLVSGGSKSPKAE